MRKERREGIEAASLWYKLWAKDFDTVEVMGLYELHSWLGGGLILQHVDARYFRAGSDSRTVSVALISPHSAI